jgi:hypothetical protein
MLPAMKSGHARRPRNGDVTPRGKRAQTRVDEPPGIILSPEDEARLVEALRKTDEAERNGAMIPWEKIRAEWGI